MDSPSFVAPAARGLPWLELWGRQQHSSHYIDSIQLHTYLHTYTHTRIHPLTYHQLLRLGLHTWRARTENKQTNSSSSAVGAANLEQPTDDDGCNRARIISRFRQPRGTTNIPTLRLRPHAEPNRPDKLLVFFVFSSCCLSFSLLSSHRSSSKRP